MDTENRRAIPSPCPICTEPIEDEQQVIFCPDCGEAYHNDHEPYDCWAKVGKTCRVRGCGGRVYPLWSRVESKLLRVLGIASTDLVSRCPNCDTESSPLHRYCVDCGHQTNDPKSRKTFRLYPFAKWVQRHHRALIVLLGTLSILSLYLGGAYVKTRIQGYARYRESSIASHTVAVSHTRRPRSIALSSSAQETQTPVPMQPKTASASATKVTGPTDTARPTPTSRPTPTKEPSPTLVPSATPCGLAVGSRFADVWNRYRVELGCPINQAHTHESASQDFERGFLLWRVNPDQVYVMYDDGRLGFYPMSRYPEDVRQHPPGGDPDIQPPPGFQQPVRGFGLIWRDNPEVREGVGWAVEGEARADWYYGFEAQDFVGGTIIHECRMGVRVLLSSGMWIQVSSGDRCG